MKPNNECKPYRKLGTIENPNDLLDYCKTLKLKSLTRSYYAENGRLECWIKWGSNLRSLKPFKGANNKQPVVQHKILTLSSGYVEVPTDKVEDLGNKVMERATGNPSWDSCLVTNNGGISWHRDHGIFQNWGVLINLGSRAMLEIADNYKLELVNGDVDKSILILKPGEVVAFNTKCLHRSTVENKSLRYMMLFHRFKDGWEQYLPKDTKRIYERITGDRHSC